MSKLGLDKQHSYARSLKFPEDVDYSTSPASFVFAASLCTPSFRRTLDPEVAKVIDGILFSSMPHNWIDKPSGIFTASWRLAGGIGAQNYWWDRIKHRITKLQPRPSSHREKNFSFRIWIEAKYMLFYYLKTICLPMIATNINFQVLVSRLLECMSCDDSLTGVPCHPRQGGFSPQYLHL